MAIRPIDPEETWIDIGRVGRPQGIHGEVRVTFFNEDSDLLDGLERVRLLQTGQPAQVVAVEALRPAGKAWAVRFSGVKDRSEAAALTHALVSVSERDLPELEEDEFYLQDLVGATVHDAASGEQVGRVTGLLHTNRDLLEIALDGGGKAMLPVEAEAIESMGREAGRVVIRDIEDWRSE